MKRIYISGPMTGMPELNFPAFHAEAARLTALGYDVVNPDELNPEPENGWHECMRNDLADNQRLRETARRLVDVMERSDLEQFENAQPVSGEEWFDAIREAKGMLA